MRNIVSRFAAAGSDGHLYSVEVVQNFIAGEHGGAMTANGPRKLFTSNGQRVTRVRQGRYKVTQTGVTLTSTVRTAP